MQTIPRTLNDAFIASLELGVDERKDYTPGDVDREKVYAAWVELLRRNGKSIPTTVVGLVQLSDNYLSRALEFLERGQTKKALAYGYFGAMLALKSAMASNIVDKDLSMRDKLRSIEKRLREEELTPKLLTAK